MVDNAELDQQEVLHGSLSGYSSVTFSKGIDSGLSHSSSCLLLLDLKGSFLGDFKGRNQSGILKNSGSVCVRKVLQQGSLKTGKSDLELVLLTHELFLGLFEIWLLELDNHSQKLVLKT